MKRLLGSDSDSLLLSDGYLLILDLYCSHHYMFCLIIIIIFFLERPLTKVFVAEGYGPMMDEDGAEEELGGGLGCGGGGGSGEKKRRLSAEQVRALEKNFEVENKLEPERKARLAQELGLQPRQVAVWFQNRRARWKTKQLERDYGALKARYDALRADRDALLLDKESLLAEVKALKSKVGAGVGEESSSFTSVKEEEASPELEEPIAPPTLADDNEPVTVIFTNKPDVGSSDSDSSAVVNDADHSPLLTTSTAATTTTATMAAGVDFTHNFFYQTLMKVEDSHGGFDVEEPCSSFFSDEPPPTLPWYADHWN